MKYGTWIKQRFDVKSGEIVAMDMPNCDVFVWTWFGLWAIGAKPAFINYNLTDKPLVHSIHTSTARVVLVHENLRDKYSEELVQELGKELCFFDPMVLGEIERTVPKREPDECRSGQSMHDMGLLIYTSGTTGLPKPAVVSWTKAAIAPVYIGKWLPLKKESVVYTSMPLYHSSASLLALMAVLYAGSTLSVGAKFHRKQFWEDVRATGATHIQYVGETLRYLLSSPPSPLDKAHKVQAVYGNGLRPDVWSKFKERFGVEQINEFYAATEGSGALWNASRNSFAEGAVGMSGPIARILLGGKGKVLKMDEDMEAPIRDPKTGLCIQVTPGEPGELVFKLDEKNIEEGFQGYFGNKQATSKKILRDVLVKGDAYFSTGDVLRRDSEGRWYFCDRIGDTYRWKSENVSTAEVAEVLGRVEKISEANVYGVEVPGHDGRAGCAALVLHDDHGAEIGDPLLRQLASVALRSLPRYAVPIFLRVLSKDTAEGNRTGTNKQQKHKFRSEGIDPELVGQTGDVLFWLPSGRTEYVRFGAAEWKSLSAGQSKL
jgi:acyl-CoA synthetase (AMP-forming)/AMP-acid ligase II